MSLYFESETVLKFYNLEAWFGTKLLHAYVQCDYIVKVKYQITPSKAVVGVDRHMKALSMHTQKPY